MIILHFDLKPQFKYMNYFIYTSHKIKNNNLKEEKKYPVTRFLVTPLSVLLLNLKDLDFNRTIAIGPHKQTCDCD